MMLGQIFISVVGIIVLMAGALILGFTIHFFIVSRQSLNASIDETPGGKISRELSDWKLRYFNDIEQRDKDISDLKIRLTEAEDNYAIYSIEAEEMRKQNKLLMSEMESLRANLPAGEKQSQFEQLRLAQNSLLEYNEKIRELLEKIDVKKYANIGHRQTQDAGAEISALANELKSILEKKEKEFQVILEKENLTPENRNLLDSVLEEFKVLQGRVQHLEHNEIVSKETKSDNAAGSQDYFRVSRDLEEQKLKNNVLVSENNQLKAHLNEIESKLIESNFRQQQMLKKIVTLEDLQKGQQGGRDASKNTGGIA